MKEKILVFIFIVIAFSVFAQGTTRLPTVGVAPFETSGTGVNAVTAADAAEATRLVIRELRSWGFMTILEGDDAKNAEYLVRSQITRQNNQIILSAVTTDTGTGRTLKNSKEQAPVLSEISIETFCEQITENVPYPNYMVGKWQSTVNMPDGPIICILEFLSDRSVRVQQYDTWEYSGTNSLKYQAIGGGTYTYAGYRRRNVTINNRVIQADATVGINLMLEDALPKYKNVSRTGIRVLFDETKNSLELVNAGFPCGDNFAGPSIYPSATVSYTRFNKIQ